MCFDGIAVAAEAEFAWTQSDGVVDRDWFVVHVKSRQEKALASDLRTNGVAHFLPLVREAKYHGKRKAFVSTPLFPGYLFLRGSIEDLYRSNSTRRVAHILRVPDQRQLDRELRSLHLALSNRPSLEAFPFLRNGIRVEVRSGPFRGLQGVIKDRATRDRLILQVEMLGKAASLEIDGTLLVPLD